MLRSQQLLAENTHIHDSYHVTEYEANKEVWEYTIVVDFIRALQ